jgi:hypothetical protein
MDKEQFLIDVESIIESQVKNSYPRHWDEDAITHSMLREFETLLANVTITDLSPDVLKINWQAFKFEGEPHYKFGDIALLVNIKYQDGDTIEGVAFIEAKKKTCLQVKFQSIKKSQLKRIFKNAEIISFAL